MSKNFTGKHLCYSFFCNKVSELGVQLFKKDSNTGVSQGNLRIFKNTYFEDHLWITAFSSSFKLDLVDLTVFSDLNLRLAKTKPFTTVCISKFSTATFLLYYVIMFKNYQTLFIYFQWIDVKNNRCSSDLSLTSSFMRIQRE